MQMEQKGYLRIPFACFILLVYLFIFLFFLANQERKENEEKITKDNTIHERERESKIQQQKSRYIKKNECKIQQDTKNKTKESVYNIWREKTDFKSQNRKQRNSTV